MQNLKWLSVIVCILQTFFLPGNVLAQSLLQKKDYQQNYFQWPIKAAVGLAANFGELRPNHYHMGLDARSDQAENKDIFAAADGYVAKVKVEPWGFGQAIYVNHPNGMTTLYAHLNSFYPELEAYVKAKQYELKSWKVFIDIPANLFPVQKGKVIAKSGNTGGSMGPHLHFEVRDTKTDKVLNPLLMGFPVTDNIAPDIIRLAVYDRCKSTYEQTPKIIALKKIGKTYVPVSGKIMVNTEKVSFAITAYDRYTGSTNQNGIYQAEMFVDGRAVSGFQLDSISYDETRYLNANVDYKTRSAGGSWLQHLSRLPGYPPGVYVTDSSHGVVTLQKSVPKKITIKVSDTYDNFSTLEFEVQMDRIIETNSNVVTNKVKDFHPGFVNVFENGRVKFYLPETALYDSFSFRYAEIPKATGGYLYQLHNSSVPLQNYIKINIKENFMPALQNKIVMKRSAGAKKDFSSVELIDGWYSASFREFGQFELLVDTAAPVVTPIGFSNGINAAALSRITFTVKDNSEDLQSFNAYLDGNWLRFSHDKDRYYVYRFDEKCSKGNHVLKIEATDLAGNITEKTYNFTR